MIAWSTGLVPKWKQVLYQFRIAQAQLSYFDHAGFKRGRLGLPRPAIKQGYQSRLSALRNKYREQPCTVICNGPSLADVDPSLIRKTVSIGCNGIYKNFEKWGFATDFLLFEDIDQFEIRAPDLKIVKGPQKMAAIYNAYALSDRKDWLFFNAPRCSRNGYYWSEDDAYPQFSEDFASVVHLGGTVTYIMLQLAFHLGCNPVYIVGLDHNYGKLPELFPPGLILITEENYELVRQCHFDPEYYSVGDVIGVPWVAKQELAFAKALQVYVENGRQLFNASERSKLKIIPAADYEQLQQV